MVCAVVMAPPVSRRDRAMSGGLALSPPAQPPVEEVRRSGVPSVLTPGRERRSMRLVTEIASPPLLIIIPWQEFCDPSARAKNELRACNVRSCPARSVRIIRF